MITKIQANRIIAGYNSFFFDRIASALEAGARGGVLGGVFSYGSASNTDADAANTALSAAGWSVIQDNVGKTLTVS